MHEGKGLDSHGVDSGASIAIVSHFSWIVFVSDMPMFYLIYQMILAMPVT